MGIKEIFKLKSTDKIYHKHYGICTVIENKFDQFGGLFGLVIHPDSTAGQLLLMYHSGMPKETPLLETSYRLILCKVEVENGYYNLKIKI